MQPSSNPFDTARRPRLRICIPWILDIVAPQAPVMAQKLAWEHAFRSSQDGKGAAAALHSDGKTSVSPQKPAKPGEIITLFGTGLGLVSPSLGTGEPSSGNNTGVLPTVTVDSQSATVKFSGAGEYSDTFGNTHGYGDSGGA
jgi:uncharacterized protein (TIGR03437 family)